MTKLTEEKERLIENKNLDPQVRQEIITMINEGFCNERHVRMASSGKMNVRQINTLRNMLKMGVDTEKFEKQFRY